MKPVGVHILYVVIVALLVVAATEAFQASEGDSFGRLFLSLPLFPGIATGLALSGHGGNVRAAFGISIFVNTAVWVTVLSLWLFVRRRIRR